jgi:uncharacterized membrane protein
VAAADDRDVSEREEVTVPDGEPFRVRAERPGYVQGLDAARLVDLAERNDLVLRADCRVGGFSMPGIDLLSVWGSPPPADLIADLRAAYVIGDGRTPHQDPELGIIELVDIAVKALSPGINDPTTAILAIDRLGQLVAAIGTGRPAAKARRDGDGVVRLFLPPYGFAYMAAMAFDQVRHYGVSNPSVARKLLATLGEVAALLRAPERRVLEEMIRHTARAADAQITDPEDLERVRTSAVSAIATARGPRPENGTT